MAMLNCDKCWERPCVCGYEAQQKRESIREFYGTDDYPVIDWNKSVIVEDQKTSSNSSYTCVECKRHFETGWNEEEVRAHHTATAPGYKFEDCEKVCIECYEKLFKEICQ